MSAGIILLMTRSITTAFFDLGDTLWHFPNMPPREFIRKETVRRIRELLASWDYHFEGERFYPGRDIRLAVEEETSRAFHGDCVDPNYPELCRRVAARHDLDLTAEQGQELWEAWNLGGAFLGRELFPDSIRERREEGASARARSLSSCHAGPSAEGPVPG